MAITYDSGNNTISVVGGSEASPYSFEDIYQADVSNGWGVVNKQGERQYYQSANLQIGDGSTSTFFKDTQKAIELNGEFTIKANANAQFGEWDSEHTKDGCYIYFAKLHTSLVYYEIYGTLKLYGCLLFAKKDGTTQRIYIKGQSGSTTDYRESIFCDFRGLRFANTDANVQNVKIRNVLYGYYVDSPLEHKWSSVFTDETLSVAYTSGTVTIYNLETPRIELYGSTSTLHLELVDAVNTIKPTIGSNDDECQLIYKYTTTIKVIDKDGNAIKDATVQIIDKDGNVVDTQLTDDDGIITTEVIGRRYYGQDETLDIRTPHTIKIEKDDYKTVEFVETIDKPINIEVCLNPEAVSMSDILNELQEHRNAVEPRIDTTISSRASQSSVDDIPINPLLDNDSRLDNLDATISSRSSHSPADVWSYTTRELSNPDNYKADVSSLALETTSQSIKNQTDKLTFDASNNIKSIAQNSELNNLDDTVSSRASQDSIDDINNTLSTLVSDIWSYSTRTLTSFGNLVSNIWNYTTRTLTEAVSIASSDKDEIADKIWDEAVTDHTNTGTFGAKNQNKVPSENVNDYKADVSNLSLETTSQSIKSQTDKMQFTANNDIKATLDGEKVNLIDTTESQIDNIENNVTNVDQYKADVSNLALEATVQTIKTKVEDIEHVEKGNWEIDTTNNQMIFYKQNGDELMRFNLYDDDGNPSTNQVFRREKV